jgi:hypothetical protein
MTSSPGTGSRILGVLQRRRLPAPAAVNAALLHTQVT